MKTLLVPTDFTANADNAMRFAMVLAKAQKGKVILHHSFQLPVAISEIPYEVLEQERQALRKAAKKQLAVRSKELQNASIDHETDITEGSIADSIINAAKEKNVQLVVMGTRGSNDVGDALFGTNAANIIEQANCPVLAIPEGAQFNKPVKTITYATDYHKNDVSVVTKVIEFAKLFNAQVTILHIATDSITPKEEKELMEDFKNLVTKTVQYNKLAFQVMYGRDVKEKLQSYLAEGCTDLLVMSTHKRKFFEKLFTRSLTKQVSQHTGVPIIAFHYNKKPALKIY